jgi:glycosyltransferase involved in cell wall biosynthesis
MKMNGKQPKLVAVLNSSIALGFLQGQLEYFHRRGFDVAVLCPKRRSDEWPVERPKGISMIEVPMERKIAPLRDLASIWSLWRTLRAVRPTVTNVGTPKAGLLGGFAAWLNRVPARFYTLHGLRFETTKGLKRQLLVWAEWLACRFAHRVICVSHSVRKKAIACGLTTWDRSVVLGSGSCNGVDISRFTPNPKLIRRAGELRKRLKIPPCATAILFIGRLTRDKGIPELMRAFAQLNKDHPNLRLVLAGCFEQEDPLPEDIRESMEKHPHVTFVGPVEDTPAYYAMADIVVLPSHREGLPTVVLEAQAAGKPVVGASATGIVDLIKDGETGFLFPVGDVAALCEALERLIKDGALAERLGRAGTEQIKRDFQQEQIWEAIHREYMRILRRNDRSHDPFAIGAKTGV